jgi:nitroimidazol reductase NimA-like FMN-containing flavoprotein (pyridoxamine 5'-phosphate oxidase superfamily)
MTTATPTVTPPSERTTVKRLPDRGRYDHDTVASILDASLVCHLGFVVDGQPFVVPTIAARVEQTVYVHGSPASRVLRGGRAGIDVCLTVSLIDGLVVARSAFHHSLNYRSVMVVGTARVVVDADEKRRAVEAITNHVVPGRWSEARQPTDKELKATSVLALSLAEASAKMRTGQAVDEPDDLDLAIWAGVVPLETTTARPVADPALRSGIPVPPSVEALVAAP